MKRTTNKTLTITADHAVRALHTLIAEGKLTATDVGNALKRRQKLIAALRDRLAALESGAIIASKNAEKQVARRVARKKRKMTAARRATLKLHGRYLGHIRTLSVANRAKIKSIREKSGVRAAIAAARKMAK